MRAVALGQILNMLFSHFKSTDVRTPTEFPLCQRENDRIIKRLPDSLTIREQRTLMVHVSLRIYYMLIAVSCLHCADATISMTPGRVAQWVTCLVTDAKLIVDPGVASSIPARSHTFVESDHEIFSTVILLPSAESFMKGCCQLQAKVCARLLVNCLFKLAQEKSVVR